MCVFAVLSPIDTCCADCADCALLVIPFLNVHRAREQVAIEAAAALHQRINVSQLCPAHTLLVACSAQPKLSRSSVAVTVHYSNTSSSSSSSSTCIAIILQLCSIVHCYSAVLLASFQAGDSSANFNTSNLNRLHRGPQRTVQCMSA